MQGIRAIIRVDSSKRMGGGHVMRCLTLANTLALRGASVTFVAAMMLPSLAEKLGKAGHRLVNIEPEPDLQLDQGDWDSRILSQDAQRRDAAATRAAAGPSEWTIVDHYRLDAAWESAADHGKVLVIDDLANRPHRCDILIDQTFGRMGSDYAAYVPERCIMLTGTLYAILRPEFAAARHEALYRRRAAVDAPRILVSLGSTDVGGITEHVVAAIDSAAPTCLVDVILSADADSLPVLRHRARVDPRLTLHIDSQFVHSITAQADLAVGAAGTSSWERCCLGLPAIVLAIAQNQTFLAAKLVSADAAILATSPKEAGSQVALLIANFPKLAAMSAAAAALVDGNGADRVVEAMYGTGGSANTLHIRDARTSDSEMLWLWRNDPHVRANSKMSSPIAWTDHAKWYAAVLSSDFTDTFIVQQGGAAVGMVRFDTTGDSAVISINIAPEARGRGIGSAALRMACDLYLKRHPDITLRAEVHETNTASMRIFVANGFVQEDAPREAFHRLRLLR